MREIIYHLSEIETQPPDIEERKANKQLGSIYSDVRQMFYCMSAIVCLWVTHPDIKDSKANKQLGSIFFDVR